MPRSPILCLAVFACGGEPATPERPQSNGVQEQQVALRLLEDSRFGREDDVLEALGWLIENPTDDPLVLETLITMYDGPCLDGRDRPCFYEAHVQAALTHAGEPALDAIDRKVRAYAARHGRHPRSAVIVDLWGSPAVAVLAEWAELEALRWTVLSSLARMELTSEQREQHASAFFLAIRNNFMADRGRPNLGLRAMRSLGTSAAPLVPQVVELAVRNEAGVSYREPATAALRRIGAEGVPGLIAVLEGESRAQKELALEILVELGGDAAPARSALLAITQDPDQSELHDSTRKTLEALDG